MGSRSDISGLKLILTGLENFKEVSKSVKNFIGFNPDLPEERKFALFKSGFWGQFPFGYSRGFVWSLRIQPGKDLERWSVCESNSHDSVYTFSPSLSAFNVIRKASTFSNQKQFSAYNRRWDEVEPHLQESVKYFGGEQFLPFLEKYCSTIENASDGSDEFKLATFLQFWDEVDDPEGKAELFGLLAKLKTDADYYPATVQPHDFWPWRERIINLQSVRCCQALIKVRDLKNFYPVFWESFKQVHGLDPQDNRLSPFPNRVADAKGFIARITENMGLNNFQDMPEEIEKSPLFAALVSLHQNVDNYIGVQHAEAALLYEQELGDPVMAWNCLLSSGFWSGQNSNETFLPAWEMAIKLAEAYEWTDAYEALTHNWKFYHDFKQKHNLA